MKPARILTFFVAIFLFTPSIRLLAQHTEAQKTMAAVIKKEVTFIVRKPDKVKNIASRFHISPRLLTGLNRPIRRGQVMYTGKSLVIPVWLRRRTDGPGSPDFNLTDYRPDPDSLDYYVREDFVCMIDVEADTIRRAKINREIIKIDRRIEAVNKILDSIEEDGMHKLSNRDIRKMPMARARRSGDFSVGLQIDSLMKQKKKISEERTKIDMRMSDYEYLIENAGYMASHPGNDDLRVIRITGDADDSPAKDHTTKKN